MIRVLSMLLLTAFGGAGSSIAATPIARVTIEVRGLSPGRGQVLLGLCTEAQFLSPKCAFQTVVRVGAARVVQVTATVPQGRYAAQAVYDLNRNARMDSNMMGIPLEPVGFSRDAAGVQGPPSFAAAAVDVRGAKRIVITLR